MPDNLASRFCFGKIPLDSSAAQPQFFIASVVVGALMLVIRITARTYSRRSTAENALAMFSSLNDAQMADVFAITIPVEVHPHAAVHLETVENACAEGVRQRFVVQFVRMPTGRIDDRRRSITGSE